jgi:hypothetical protein
VLAERFFERSWIKAGRNLRATERAKLRTSR